MLTLSRPMRQAIASLAVLGLFVAPTAYVGWLAWDAQRPEHRRRVERELSRTLGMSIAIGQVRYPRPGEMILQEVTVQDPDVSGPAGRGKAAIRAQRLRVAHRSGGITLEADGLSVRLDGPRELVHHLASLLGRRGAGDVPVSFLARSCRIETGAASSADVNALVGVIRPDPLRPEVNASWRIGPEPDSPRCEASFIRDLSEETARSRVVLRTLENAPLPAAVLEPFFASRAWLGAEARVEGELLLERADSSEWAASFHGSLLDVDLAALAARLAPENRASGRGVIRVEASRWADQPGRGPGWVEARGTLTAGPGILGSRLARAMCDQLGFLAGGEDAGVIENDLEFRSIGLRFAFEADGAIHLQGGLGPEHRAGAVVVGGSSRDPSLMEPRGPVVVASLIRALVPEDPSRPDELVPARFESLIMQRHLPAPAGTITPTR